MKRRVVSLALASVMAVGSLAGVASAETGTTGSVKSNIPFINGYSDGTFRPALTVTRAEVAKMVATRAQLAGVDSKFSDTKTHWANKYIGALADKGMIGGYPDGTFRPDGGLTRAEATKILVDANGGATDGAKATFPDAKDHWASKYIAKAAELGIVNGYPDGNFQPDAKVSREEAVAFVNRAYGRMDANIAANITDLKNPFKDVASGRWSEKLILAASMNFDYTVDANGKETIVNINAAISSVDVKVDKMAPTVSITTKDVIDGTNAKVEILDKDGKVVETKSAEIKSNAGSVTFGTLPEGDYTAKVTVGSVSKTATFSTKVEGMVVEGVDTIAWPTTLDWDKIGNDRDPAAVGFRDRDLKYNPYMTLKFKVNGVEKTAEDMVKEGYKVTFESTAQVLQNDELSNPGASSIGKSTEYTSNKGNVDVRNIAWNPMKDFTSAGNPLFPASGNGAKFDYEVKLEKDGETFTSEQKTVTVVDKSLAVKDIETTVPNVLLLSTVGKVTIDKMLNEAGDNIRNSVVDNLLKRATGNVQSGAKISDVNKKLNELGNIKIESLNPDIVKIAQNPNVGTGSTTDTVPAVGNVASFSAIPVDVIGNNGVLGVRTDLGASAPDGPQIYSLYDMNTAGSSVPNKTNRQVLADSIAGFEIGAIGVGSAEIKITVGNYEKIVKTQVVKTDNVGDLKFDKTELTLRRADIDAKYKNITGNSQELIFESRSENGQLRDVTTADNVVLGLQEDNGTDRVFNESFQLVDLDGNIQPLGDGTSGGQVAITASDLEKFKVSEGTYKLTFMPNRGVFGNAANGNMNVGSTYFNVVKNNKLAAQTKITVKNEAVASVKPEVVSGSETRSVGVPEISTPTTSLGKIRIAIIGYNAAGDRLGRVSSSINNNFYELVLNNEVDSFGEGIPQEPMGSEGNGLFEISTDQPSLLNPSKTILKVGDNTMQLKAGGVKVGTAQNLKITNVAPEITGLSQKGNTVQADGKKATDLFNIDIDENSVKNEIVTKVWNPTTERFVNEGTLLFNGITVGAAGEVQANYTVTGSLVPDSFKIGEARVVRGTRDDADLVSTVSTNYNGGVSSISSSAFLLNGTTAASVGVNQEGSFTVVFVDGTTTNTPLGNVLINYIR